MSEGDGKKTIVERLVALDNRFHSVMPVRDIYSKLFFRTILWFAFFALVYRLYTGL